MPRGTVETPFYEAVLQDRENQATRFWMITVDEGWRSQILCTDMYEWAAYWLVDQLQGKPYPQAG
jgi:hypothetical protein